MDHTKRFSNKTGEEYDLFSMALPHQDIIQKRVSEILSQHYSADKYKDKEKEIIETLEIGFGTGLTTQALLSKDARVRIIAVDNEPLMFAQASDKLRSYPKERLTLHTIDVFDYLKKIESNSFDAVASAWTLHNFHNDFRNKVLKEIYRVLKPGAIFINGDKMAVSDPHIHQAHLDWQIKRFDIFDTIQKPEVKKTVDRALFRRRRSR
jgi:tRNA (cmo5U34)-methyltransferase